MKNPSNGRRVAPFVQTDTTKLIGAFRNFAKLAYKNIYI